MTSAVGAHAGRAPEEIAPDVYWLEAGRGLMRSSVYFVRSGASWVLVDAASASCGRAIEQAARMLFGADRPASGILLTHDHPDHAGSAHELASLWGCPVWAHRDELPLAVGSMRAFHTWANPLDRRLLLPLMELLPARRREAMIAGASLAGVVRALPPSGPPPGLPEWEVIRTPGHTPGHVAFFRRKDRVLLSGDALLTERLGSLRGLLLRRPGLSKPTWIVTWSERVARESIDVMARLAPQVVASGHGKPMVGQHTPDEVRLFAERLGVR